MEAKPEPPKKDLPDWVLIIQADGKTTEHEFFKGKKIKKDGEQP